MQCCVCVRSGQSCDQWPYCDRYIKCVLIPSGTFLPCSSAGTHHPATPCWGEQSSEEGTPDTGHWTLETMAAVTNTLARLLLVLVLTLGAGRGRKLGGGHHDHHDQDHAHHHEDHHDHHHDHEHEHSLNHVDGQIEALESSFDAVFALPDLALQFDEEDSSEEHSSEGDSSEEDSSEENSSEEDSSEEDSSEEGSSEEDGANSEAFDITRYFR